MRPLIDAYATCLSAAIFFPSMEYKPSFDEEWLEEATVRITTDWENAVAACRERDERNHTYDELLEGGEWYAPLGSVDEEGCDLTDPLTLEQFLQVFSAHRVQDQPPYWFVEAIEPEDETTAPLVERWLEIKSHEERLSDYFYDTDYLALTNDFSVLYTGRRVIERRERKKLLRLKGGRLVREADLQIGDEVIEEVSFNEPVMETRLDLRAIKCTDFYVWPPDAQNINDPTVRVGERMWFTKEALINAIDELGFDEEVVDAMIKAGPTGQAQRIANEREGIQANLNDDGFYEVCHLYGRPPILQRDGERWFPNDYRYDDFEWTFSPELKRLLRVGPNPYPFRPYTVFTVFRRPGRLGGHNLCSILEPLQIEGDVNLRAAINLANYTVNPPILAPMTSMRDWDNITNRPGAIWGYRQSPAEIQPVSLDKTGVQLLLMIQDRHVARARGLVTGQALQLQPKVRKATEVAAEMRSIDTKLDFFRGNLLRSREEVARRIISLYIDHVQPDGEGFRMGQRQVRVTPEMLRRRYRFLVRSVSDLADPQTRLEKTQKKLGIQSSYLQMKRVVAPEELSLLYHGARRALEEMGERNVEAWLGIEPPSADDLAFVNEVLREEGVMENSPMPGNMGPMANATTAVPNEQNVPNGTPQNGSVPMPIMPDTMDRMSTERRNGR